MDIKAFYKAFKTLIRTQSLRKSRFVYQERRLDLSNLDDNLLIAQIGYFGHHLEKALKHHNRGTRGGFKRLKLQKLIEELENRPAKDSKIQIWANKLISYYDNEKDIYVDQEKGPQPSQSQEIIDFIKERTSIRFWQKREVSDDIIKGLIDTAMHSALSCNRQTIRFAVKKNQLENMELGDSNNQSMFAKAPVLIYVADDNRFFSEKYGNALDVGGVCASLQLAAKAFGLSATWVYFSESYDQEKTKKELGFEEYHYIYSLITIGYPLDKQEKPPRFDVKHFIVKR